MKILFAGTPDFAVPTLKMLNESEHDVVTVLTQPDRPAGRGRNLVASPVKEYALEHSLSIYQPKTLKDAAVIEAIKNIKPDLIVIIAYGLIVPKAILDMPKFGGVCVHLSLLPRWRGAAPGQRTILTGDTISGVTLIQMDTGIDTGDMLACATLNLEKNETCASLYEKLGVLGADLLQQFLPAIEAQTLTPEIQDETAMTYAVKIDKQEACINWELSAQQIERMVRAFNPWPIAYTTLNDKRLRIWGADVIKELTDAPPGMIIGADKEGIDVACGAGILRITEMQWAGSKRQTAQAIMNANNNPLQEGVIFTNTAT